MFPLPQAGGGWGVGSPSPELQWPMGRAHPRPLPLAGGEDIMPAPNEGPSVRLLRVGEQVRHVLSDILQRGDVHDDVLASHVVSVTEVRMSPDRSEEHTSELQSLMRT